MFICCSPPPLHVPVLCIINPWGVRNPCQSVLGSRSSVGLPISLSLSLSLSPSPILHVLNVSRKRTVSGGGGGVKAESKRSCLFIGAIVVSQLLCRVCQKENDYRQNDRDGGLL
jgi:hypothetical protein